MTSEGNFNYPRGIAVNFKTLKVGTLKRYANHFKLSVPEDMPANDLAAAVAKYVNEFHADESSPLL